MGGSDKQSVAISIISGCSLLVFVLVLAILAKGGKKSDAEVTAAHVRAATESKQDIRPQDRIALTYPLDCDATVTASGTPGQLPRTRCYIRKGAK